MSTSTSIVEACGMFGRVGQRLGHYVVGGDLKLFRDPPVDAHVQLDRNGAAAGQRLERRAQSAFGQDGRVDAAGQFAQARPGR